MNIANVTVKNEWVDIQDLISEATGNDFEFTPNINYYLSNSTGTPVLFLNVDSLPDETVNKGLVVAGFEQCGFKLGSGKVFARCLNGSTDIHIEQEG